MPPPAVKSVRDMICWQYARIIADSAGMGKKNRGFVMGRFKKPVLLYGAKVINVNI